MTHELDLSYSSKFLTTIVDNTQIDPLDGYIALGAKFLTGIALKVTTIALAAFETIALTSVLVASSPVLYFLPNRYSALTNKIQSARQTFTRTFYEIGKPYKKALEKNLLEGPPSIYVEDITKHVTDFVSSHQNEILVVSALVIGFIAYRSLNASIEVPVPVPSFSVEDSLKCFEKPFFELFCEAPLIPTPIQMQHPSSSNSELSLFIAGIILLQGYICLSEPRKKSAKMNLENEDPSFLSPLDDLPPAPKKDEKQTSKKGVERTFSGSPDSPYKPFSPNSTSSASSSTTSSETLPQTPPRTPSPPPSQMGAAEDRVSRTPYTPRTKKSDQDVTIDPTAAAKSPPPPPLPGKTYQLKNQLPLSASLPSPVTGLISRSLSQSSNGVPNLSEITSGIGRLRKVQSLNTQNNEPAQPTPSQIQKVQLKRVSERELAPKPENATMAEKMADNAFNQIKSRRRALSSPPGSPFKSGQSTSQHAESRDPSE